MFYASDFRLKSDRKKNRATRVFTIMISEDKCRKQIKSHRSTSVAAKPLTYFASLFGIQTISQQNNNGELCNKIYCLILILVIVLLIIFVKPADWDDTKIDIPLKILSKTRAIQETLEIIFFIFVSAFMNNKNLMRLNNIFNCIDKHFDNLKKTFTIRRILAIILIIIPIVELLILCWIRTFSIHNLVSYLIFFLLMLQGVICAFIVLNMYLNIIRFNFILSKKLQLLAPKEFILRKTPQDTFSKEFIINEQQKCYRKYCWFELMQIYDGICDSMYIFNKIYNKQILIMFNSWFMTTLLVICRSLSPSIQYSDIIISEVLMYLLINSRPMFLTKMSECFTSEARKTILLLLHVKLHQQDDNNYRDQLQLMIDLVHTRKLEISAHVFPVSIPVMVNFAGRVVSNAVLMIQYFYLYIHDT